MPSYIGKKSLNDVFEMSYRRNSYLFMDDQTKAMTKNLVNKMETRIKITKLIHTLRIYSKGCRITAIQLRVSFLHLKS